MVKKNPKRTIKSKSFKSYLVAIFSVIIIVIFVLFSIIGGIQKPGKERQGAKKENKMAGNEFKIDGKLDFFSAQNDTITSIYIEIAENDYSREKGLMYRQNIPDTVGMLFVFAEEDYHSFWMKNTPSSLDIIYVDGFGKIVRIYEFTEPFSEESIPSGDLAQYVIEVKGGFCSLHHITTKDRMEFIRFEK